MKDTITKCGDNRGAPRDANTGAERKQFRTKRGAIWNTQDYRIQRPKADLSSGKDKQTNQFEEALHVIVRNKDFLEEQLSFDQISTFRDKVTGMVLGFEANLSKAVGGHGESWSIIKTPCQKSDANKRLEGYCEDIEKMAKSIKDAKDFYRYAQYVSNIEYYFPNRDEISSQLKTKKQDFENAFNEALDYSKTEERRADARRRIGECLDWVQTQRDEGSQAYAHDLSVRTRLLKKCFDNNKDRLYRGEVGQALLRNFTDTYNRCRSSTEQTRGPNSYWKTSAYMLETFDPNVRKIEGMGLELLKHIESEPGRYLHLYSDLSKFLARAEACERRTPKQQSANQSASSTQFRECYSHIMRAAYVCLMPEHCSVRMLEEALSQVRSRISKFERVTGARAT